MVDVGIRLEQLSCASGPLRRVGRFRRAPRREIEQWTAIQVGEEIGAVSGPMRWEGMRGVTRNTPGRPEVRTHGPSPGRSSEATARVPNLSRLRCGGDFRVDSGVHGVHARADARDHGNRAQRDEAGQQGVLDQVLPFILTRQPKKKLSALRPPSWVMEPTKASSCAQREHVSCQDRTQESLLYEQGETTRPHDVRSGVLAEARNCSRRRPIGLRTEELQLLTFLSS